MRPFEWWTRMLLALATAGFPMGPQDVPLQPSNAVPVQRRLPALAAPQVVGSQRRRTLPVNEEPAAPTTPHVTSPVFETAITAWPAGHAPPTTVPAGPCGPAGP